MTVRFCGIVVLSKYLPLGKYKIFGIKIVELSKLNIDSLEYKNYNI